MASIWRSNLVSFAPVREMMGTSFTMPLMITLEPGDVFLSLSGETRSFLRSTLMRLGWSPPSRTSGDSSTTMPCASTNSLLSIRNFPFRPQPHLEGSRKVVSSWSTLMTLPQAGHSNLDAVTCGRTSDFCRTTPSMTIILLRCALLMLRIMKLCEGGSWEKRTLITRGEPFSTPRSNCCTASSAAFMTSSGLSRRSVARSGSNFDSSGNAMTSSLSPLRTFFRSSE